MTVAASRQHRRSRAHPAAPRPAEVYLIGRDASVQFAADPFNFRVSHVRDVDPYSWWLWLDGYQLNLVGEAVARRSIFVLRAGLRPPAVIPQQRRRRNRAGVVGGQ